MSAKTNSVLFRDFEGEDFPELEAMIAGLYLEDPPGQPMYHEKIARTVEVLVQHPDKGRIVVFAEGAALVGYAILVFFWSNEYGGDIVHIDELYVKKHSRSNGIGTRFFDYLVHAFPDARGFGLEVTPTNERALELYHRMGFRSAPNRHLFKHVS